jgi:NADH:ubiquinone oxidoreductase subunit F (NADH-binding)
MGLTLRELICGEQYCRGVVAGKKLKAFAPSGPSGGFLPARLTAAAGLPRNHTNKEEWKALAKRRGFDPAATQLDILDLELELNLFRALSPTQALGAGMVVYADDRDMVKEAVNAVQFFRNESCGKCVPCRIGSQKLAAMGNNLLEGRIEAGQWDDELQPLVKELGEVMMLASICGLGRSVPVPLKTLIDFFPDDLARHLKSAPLAAERAPAEMAAAK